QEHYEAYDGVADLYVYFYELALNLLRPGGRLGFIVTNKWMRAGYGEPLRRLLGKSAWVESVVDFGHAKQIFPDADVFPSILVARKPADGSQQEVPRVCAIPREQLRVDDLSRQIEAEGFPIPRARLGAEPWSLEPPGVAELMEKIRRTGLPLREFAGVAPLYGIKTGFNEAFLMDTPTKERLVAADPKSADLFRPYLRGQDVKRWCAEWTGLWMLAMKSSANHLWPWAEAGEKADAVFQATYPAIHAHLSEYRRQLTQRQDQGQYWWELRACAYWDQFDKPKIMYQDIAWQPRFCLDVAGTLSNNTVYFLPTNDLWVLAVLNSPVAWWYSWRNAQHGKDEALRFFAAFMEEFPVPRVAEGSRQKVEAAVRRLTDITAGQHETRRAFLDWLRVEFGVEKPTQRLQDLVALDADGLIREVKKARGRSRPLSVVDVKRLREEHVRSIAPVQALAAETLQLEQRVSDLVNAAYGLTPEEVALLWRTAPPRMPTDPPDDTGQPGSSGGASG
ncbi:MAG TPA: TaqI-like C-terminal specificity domain-containing protein, partial [Gemmataceae bacterium]